MLKIHLSCPKHPKFNPHRGGRAAIRGGCHHCSSLCDLANSAEMLLSLIRCNEEIESDGNPKK